LVLSPQYLIPIIPLCRSNHGSFRTIHIHCSRIIYMLFGAFPTSLILATITLTFPLNNVILLFNFPPIILILAFLSLVFYSISITLLIPIIYPPPMILLLLVNGPPVMYPSFFNCPVIDTFPSKCSLSQTLSTAREVYFECP